MLYISEGDIASQLLPQSWAYHQRLCKTWRTASHDLQLIQSQKEATCWRHNKIIIIYCPEPSKSPGNHTKGQSCSTGSRKKPIEGHFHWPQPAGIFTTGFQFFPLLLVLLVLFESCIRRLLMRLGATTRFPSLNSLLGLIFSMLKPSKGSSQSWTAY
jgi:hypothetical protein